MMHLPTVPEFFILLALLLALHGSISNGDFPYARCQNTGSYTNNSTFQTNLNLLLSSLSNNTPKSGFSNESRGYQQEKVYGLALCRGDLDSKECSNCLSTAPQDLIQLCPYAREAILWYERCHMHYSANNFFSKLNKSLKIELYYETSVSDPETFDWLLGEMMDKIAKDAALGSSTRMFSTGELHITRAVQAYGLVQCTWDLSGNQCGQCLADYIQLLRKRYFGRQGALILGASCTVQYQQTKFFQSRPISSHQLPPLDILPPSIEPPLPLSAEATIKGKKRKALRYLTILAVPIGIALMVICIAYNCFSTRKTMKKQNFGEDIKRITGTRTFIFDLATLKHATDNFSYANQVGHGGFGAVYKGILNDRSEIAVKRLSRSSFQGLEQLKNEVVFVAQLQHKNLVRLLGCCLEEKEMLLVYEYIQNKSLDMYIFDPAKREQLIWEQRYNIILGIAKGLLYLHEDSRLCIVHRDLKASNILLDANMNPKISDFGLARTVAGEHMQSKTANIVGTYGYMAPEYAIWGKVSDKSDVFSFGVLVLEIVSGRRNNSFSDSEYATNLISYAWGSWTKGRAQELMDPSLGACCLSCGVLRCIHIGLLCVQDNPSDRPNMSSVILMLNRDNMELQPPARPGFLFRNSRSEVHMVDDDLHLAGVINAKPTTVSPTIGSINAVSITEPWPR